VNVVDPTGYLHQIYPEQWALSVINFNAAWANIPVDARQVTIAGIDSSICVSHPDLQGWIAAGWDFLENDAVPQDEMGHGCAIAGIIAANINGQGIAGAAPHAQIMPLRILDSLVEPDASILRRRNLCSASSTRIRRKYLEVQCPLKTLSRKRVLPRIISSVLY
jgi:subtilisin family serine protease